MQLSSLIYIISRQIPKQNPAIFPNTSIGYIVPLGGSVKYTRFRKKMITNGKKRALARFCRSCKITCR